MQCANWAELAVILYFPLTANICFKIENLRFSSSAKTEIVLNLFVTFEQKRAHSVIKLFFLSVLDHLIFFRTFYGHCLCQ